MNNFPPGLEPRLLLEPEFAVASSAGKRRQNSALLGIRQPAQRQRQPSGSQFVARGRDRLAVD
jgi:hypothetical protein